MAADPAMAKNCTSSNVVPYTIKGQAVLTVNGCSQIPKTHESMVSSEPFEVGGHRWVLVFFPVGNRPNLGQAVNMNDAALLTAAARAAEAAQIAAASRIEDEYLAELEFETEQRAAQGSSNRVAAMARPQQQLKDKQAQKKQKNSHPSQSSNKASSVSTPAEVLAAQAAIRGQLKKARNIPELAQYASVFVVRVGSGRQPQGIRNVRMAGDDDSFPAVSGYHSLTLVNHTKPENSITLSHGAAHPNGWLHIRCKEGPVDYDNTLTRWGQRKFIKRSILENPESGFIVKDSLVIRYSCELFVTHGGAAGTARCNPYAAEVPRVPPSTRGRDMAEMLQTGQGSDFTISLQHDGFNHEELPVHKLVLAMRSPVLRGMLHSDMAEARAGRIVIRDVIPPAANAVVHFLYTDRLPADLEEEWQQSPSLATHLLPAATAYGLPRLARLSEQRLCRSIDADNAADMLVLAELHQAPDLKRLSMQVAAQNFNHVRQTDGYQALKKLDGCSHLVEELVSQVIAIVDQQQ